MRTPILDESMASAESSHALQTYEGLAWGLFVNTAFSYTKMKILQNLNIAMCGAAVHEQSTKTGVELHAAMRAKYDENIPFLLGIIRERKLPSWMDDERLFTYCDAKFKKHRADDATENSKLWKQYMKIKREVTNRDNSCLQGFLKSNTAVPSGTQLDEAFKKIIALLFEASVVEQTVVEVGVGGSAAKAAEAPPDSCDGCGSGGSSRCSREYCVNRGCLAARAEHSRKQR